jgi:hypothetical protein
MKCKPLRCAEKKPDRSAPACWCDFPKSLNSGGIKEFKLKKPRKQAFALQIYFHASFFKSSALSVFSQVKLGSFLPK